MEGSIRDVTIYELYDSLSLETGTHHVLRVTFPELRVRLPIDPDDAAHRNDRFVLTMRHAGRSSETVQTICDDRVPGDGAIDLVFGQLMPGAIYTLRVLPGEGVPYTVFEERAHDQLFGA